MLGTVVAMHGLSGAGSFARLAAAVGSGAACYVFTLWLVERDLLSALGRRLRVADRTGS
jgi:hypothetical protein